jgi:hypothetical protein
VTRIRAIAYATVVVHAIALALTAAVFFAGRMEWWVPLWICWILAALTLVALLGCLSRTALVIALLTLPIDTTCNVLYILRGPSPVVDIWSRGVANGLYTIAMLFAVRRDPLGWGAVAGGLLLSIASFAGVQRLEQLAGAILFSFFIAWAIRIARRA